MMCYRKSVACVVGLAFAVGCGPIPEDDSGDDVERIEQAVEPVTATGVLAAGAAILAKKLFEKAVDKVLAEIFAATAKETPPDVLPILYKLENQIATEAAHINWLQIRTRSEDKLIAALTAVTEGRRVVEQGRQPQQESTSDHNSAAAWAAYLPDTLFLRQRDHFACPTTSLTPLVDPVPGLWPCIIAARATPQGPAGNTYDHRLTSEVMLRVVALRIAYIAMMAPDFIRTGFFKAEIMNMLSMLQKHRKTIEDGIVCGHRDVVLTAGKFPSGPNSQWARFIACADLHTGQGLVRKQAKPADAWFNDATTASLKSQLRGQLWSRTSLRHLDSIAADLAWYADPDVVTRLTVAQSNDVLTGWPVAHAVDGVPETAYSSHIFPTQQNTRGTFVAAWTGLTTTVQVNQLRITPRMWNGAVQAFPQRYYVWVTAADNSQWLPIGYFTAQPDHRGAARVDLGLGATYQTFGVYIWPETLGADSFGGRYFQVAELALAKAY